ncbi:hypothetical protein AB833_16885 [Chromatiales bacterium (ex Bugula neritina AB1)]|nr:hypothetical protein AB833_16885 [Chromatiales bacterium (ex Bugula neritina AB1)]
MAKTASVCLGDTDNRLVHWAPAAVITLLSLALFIPDQASARWYKWVDDSGNISYQDRPPPANYGNSTQVLNERGVAVKRIPSKQERKAQEAKLAAARAQRLHDQMLIKSFPHEEDLTRTRDKKLGHIDGTVSRMHDQLVILNSRLVSINAKIERNGTRGQSSNASLESDKIAVIRSIDSTNALIKSKLRERRQVAKKFSADLNRYRELVSQSTTADHGSY